VVQSGFIRIAQMVALALIVIDLADSGRKLDLVAKALVLGALFAAGTTLYQSEVLDLRRAGGNIAGGINDTAALLVTVVPLAFYLLRTSDRFIWGVVGTLYLGIAAVSVVVTFSRLNLLLMPPLLLVLYLLTLRDRRGRRWLVAVTVAGAAAATVFVPWAELADRAQTIDAYVDQTMRFGQAQTVTTPRGYHMRVGLAIARDHPFIGVGYGNYGFLFRDEYQFQVPGSTVLYGSVRSPHSAYIGIAADLGGVGLAAWLVLLGLSAASVAQAWRLARARGLRNLVPLIEALALMLGLHMFAYGFYAPNQTDKLLWLIMAMCIAVRIVVTDGVKDSDLIEHRSESSPEDLPSGALAGSSSPVNG